jgi:CRISPR-associated endonuclease/helicase Cas3
MTAEVTDRAAAPAREQFADFFREVHGTDPFPWQEGLLDRVVRDGWPALIDVPTGLGKTAILDIAVFASAMAAAQARRRIFMVVDRRLIVDQAYEHASRIQQSLTSARPGSTCHAVAACLAMPGDDGPVLDVTRMRGGIDWSWLWLERPDRHAIITGTVDQVGSRLLFRGYGVGEQLRPIDAALAGTDSLIIVDEAHLSDPFLATLGDIAQLDRPGTGRAPVVVAMSASPGEQDPATHRISADDEEHPVASKRLNAPKRLHLLSVPGAKAASRDNVAAAMAQWATEIGGPGRVTGVVANTVAMARAVFSHLQAALPESAQCVLLTGRIRPVDRDYLLAQWLPRIRAGADRDPSQALYVVATQTIEVGADIDLDGMITESAALPALIQRLGRVNRRGDRTGAPVIVVHSDALDDRVYGEARLRTWEWLTSLPGAVALKAGKRAAALEGGIGVSPARLRHLLDRVSADDLAAMRGGRPYAPLVWADTLDAWARTSPAPHPDVPVAPYLHGIEAGEPTASLVWRTGLSGDDPRQWAQHVELLPPSADEALELPVGTIRRWLASRPGTGSRPAGGPGTGSRPGTADEDNLLSDAEAHAPASAGDAALDASPVGVALRYGPDGGEPVSPGQVRAGDLIIVPASWGGCDRFGWAPASASAVTDVADLAGGNRRVPAVIRIGPTLTHAMKHHAPDLAEPIGQLIAQVTADLGDDAPDVGRYRSMLRQLLAPQPAGGARESLPHERVLRRLAVAGQLTRSDPVLLSDRGAGWSTDATAAGTSANPAAQPMSLAAHQEAVRARARQFATNLSLPEDIIRAVELAAAHHDEGKRDPRFQRMLHGGDKWLHAAATEPLAKSGMDPADRAAFHRAWQLSGYPAGMRHEALSARIAAPLVAREPDPDLVIHLIASHHGFARPLLPPINDPAPVPVTGPGNVVLDSAQTVDWDGPARFGRLCERHGRWGLALLEAIVRLADIWCSARSEEPAEDSW